MQSWYFGSHQRFLNKNVSQSVRPRQIKASTTQIGAYNNALHTFLRGNESFMLVTSFQEALFHKAKLVFLFFTLFNSLPYQFPESGSPDIILSSALKIIIPIINFKMVNCTKTYKTSCFHVEGYAVLSTISKTCWSQVWL